VVLQVAAEQSEMVRREGSSFRAAVEKLLVKSLSPLLLTT